MKYLFLSHNQIKQFVFIFTILLFNQDLYANNVKITHVNVINNRQLSFYISWENAWNYPAGTMSENFDAIWVIVKSKKENENWKHVLLDNNQSSHHTANDSLQIIPSTDSVGAVLRMKNYGNTYLIADTVYLTFANAFEDGIYDFKIFATEMVYVPTGAFYIGDSLSNNTFSCGNSKKPFYIYSENEIIIGNQANQLGTTANYSAYSNIPNTYPKGYNGFLCMKYEISQQQYVEFLNTLTFNQQLNRIIQSPTAAIGTFVFSSTGLISNRNGIIVQNNGITEQKPATFACNASNDNIYNASDDGISRACNFLNWADLCAYLDWLGLRPMTEFEFEKACRGPVYPAPLQFAFGTDEVIDANTIINDGTEDESVAEIATSIAGIASHGYTGPNGPLRCGFAGNQTTNRLQSGTSYWGIFEMSGNVWEQTVTVNQKGLQFDGSHGDGLLDNEGNANTIGWFVDGTGAGYRGGAWSSGIIPGFRDLAISDRYYAGLKPDQRRATSGGRGVRSF